jgi:inorganic pyrophosphatase
VLDLDLSVLDQRAARARVAYIVEMDHFVKEKYDFRLLCIRYLASRGWTIFGEELDWRAGERYERYLRTGDESLLDPIDEPPWYTRGVLAQASERHPKAAHDAEQKHFLRAVRRDVADVHWFGFDIGAGDPEYLRSANDADTFEALLPVMAHRERLIHERVARVLGENPDAKVALMAGSTHLLKDDDACDAPGGIGPGGDTEPSIGHFVVHSLLDGPDDVLSIWMLHGRGRSANPWLPPPGELAAAAGTVDASLASQHDEPVVVVVDRHDTERRRVTQMHNLVMTCALAEQVDALVFVPEVTPLRTPVDRPDPAEWLGRRVEVVIDRPKGSTHPLHGHVLEVDYGFVPGTLANDGSELDAYLLGVDGPVRAAEGEVVAIVQRRDDVEDKLVVAVSGTWSREDVAAAVDFQERWFDVEIIVSDVHR